MFAQINGVELFYETVGKGVPLLLMHGGLGLDHTYFPPAFDRLADQAQLIYYDHRGNGRSTRPASFEGITHQTWIEDADALRAHLGHQKIVLLGHSYGGFLAQDYALRFGDRLAGLILCDTAPVLDYPEVVMANAQARATPEQLAAVAKAFSTPMTDDADWGHTFSTILPLYFHHDHKGVRAALDARTRYSGAAYNHVSANCLPVFNALPRLGEITVPTLVISGAHDWITPLAQGSARIHAAIPGSQLAVFEESGHYPFLEETQRTLDVISAWLAGLNH